MSVSFDLRTPINPVGYFLFFAYPFFNESYPSMAQASACAKKKIKSSPKQTLER